MPAGIRRGRSWQGLLGLFEAVDPDLKGGLADRGSTQARRRHGLRLRFMTVKLTAVGWRSWIRRAAAWSLTRGKTEGRKLLITRVINLFLAEIRVRNNRKHDEVMCYRILNHLLKVYEIYLMRQTGFLRK